MLINVHCAKCVGIDAVPVEIEVDLATGIGIHLVGLADTAIKESLLRTITALQYILPSSKRNRRTWSRCSLCKEFCR